MALIKPSLANITDIFVFMHKEKLRITFLLSLFLFLYYYYTPIFNLGQAENGLY